MMFNLNYNWIDGEKVTTDKEIKVINPANQEKVGSIPDINKKQVITAIDSAENALKEWSEKTAGYRGDILEKWAQNILGKKNEIAEILSSEQGKPFREALGEVEGSCMFIKWFAEEGKRIYGEIIPPSKENQRIMVLRQPVGVCGLITPWNFPAAMITRKVAPALAAGCTCVIKPASETPLTAIALINELMKTDIPKGAVNLVTGKSELISEVLLTDSRVRKISFTGSTPVGKLLMGKASKQIKKLSLELGGNAPAIVFPDVDLDKAVDEIVNNKFENCGQMCNGINTIYVHEDVKEVLTNKIIERVEKIKVGFGNDENANIGPLANRKSLENLEKLVHDAVQKGAKVRVGGNKLDQGIFSQGFFFEPTVIENINLSMNLTNEEIFGPIAPIITFQNEKDVLNKVNQSDVGLAAYFFTNDINRIYYMAEQLEVGVIGVNSAQLSVPQAPFGGIKESGIGREGGRQGIEEFLEEKYISLTLTGM